MCALVLYFAIGLLFHVIFVGAHIDVSNAWTWLWLAAWPVPMLFIGLVAAVLVALVNSCVEYIKGAFR